MASPIEPTHEGNPIACTLFSMWSPQCADRICETLYRAAVSQASGKTLMPLTDSWRGRGARRWRQRRTPTRVDSIESDMGHLSPCGLPRRHGRCTPSNRKSSRDHTLSARNRPRTHGTSSKVMFRSQSIFNPRALTTGAQRATSDASDWRNFSGLESKMGSIPASDIICL